jgi:hypothetical protein
MVSGDTTISGLAACGAESSFALRTLNISSPQRDAILRIHHLRDSVYHYGRANDNRQPMALHMCVADFGDLVMKDFFSL